MDGEGRRLYKALAARDPRFDGVFFVGVTSTGIYCRPICPVKTPKARNCRFFNTAQETEQAGFRPCLRCRPELAPGSAPVDDAQRIAQLIVQRLEEGKIEGNAGLERIADQFELSSRQIRRIVQKELGVPPIQLLLTRRLLLAKQLLTETTLPVTEIAFASGFSSLRRFNDAFSTRYKMPPTRLRRKATEGADAIGESETSILQVSYRPPYDWKGVLAFLAARTLEGIEWVTADSYARTVSLGEAKGWIRLTQSRKKHALMLEFTHTLTPALPTLLSRVRALFDLNARPDMISRHLAKDAHLIGAVRRNPGMRVPGAFSGFETGLRAILGQQVTVKAATTIACRFVAAFGEPIVTPFAELNRLTPSAARVAAASVDDIARLGIVSARARSIIALAAVQGSGESLPRRRRPSSSGRVDRAAGRTARHRTVDRAIHRHARVRVARRVSEGRHRRAQPVGRRHCPRGGGTVADVAAVAELRGDASVGDAAVGFERPTTALTSLIQAHRLPRQAAAMIEPSK
jgi:AraC family transcriptional regulator of adaptative response / DNA-3-methyladenine glycosylase II